MEPIDEAGRGVRMEIREARTEDAAQACMVLRRSIQELCHADHNGDATKLADWLSNKTPENVAAWIRNPQSLVFVATEGETVLGVAAMTKAGKITLNYVSPDARFRGISKALIDRLGHRPGSWVWTAAHSTVPRQRASSICLAVTRSKLRQPMRPAVRWQKP